MHIHYYNSIVYYVSFCIMLSFFLPESIEIFGRNRSSDCSQLHMNKKVA